RGRGGGRSSGSGAAYRDGARGGWSRGWHGGGSAAGVRAFLRNGTEPGAGARLHRRLLVAHPGRGADVRLRLRAEAERPTRERHCERALKKRRSRMHQFELIVVGSGPGGQRVATQAAKLRKRVVMCEKC